MDIGAQQKNETTVYAVFKDVHFIQEYCKYMYGHTCTSLHVLENINNQRNEKYMHIFWKQMSFTPN